MATSSVEVTAEDLHGVLVRAFERIKPLGCRACTVPRPQRSVEAGGPNWVLPAPGPCEFNCTAFIQWLWRQYGAQYRLKFPD